MSNRDRGKRSAWRFGAVVILLATLGAASGLVHAAPSRSLLGEHASRVAGDNRYETAVAISQTKWNEQNTTTVYLASGESLPDALALGASTGEEGPILFVRSTSMPDVVAREIQRLQPCNVVAVGGPAVVSDDVIHAAMANTQRTGCP